MTMLIDRRGSAMAARAETPKDLGRTEVNDFKVDLTFAVTLVRPTESNETVTQLLQVSSGVALSHRFPSDITETHVSAVHEGRSIKTSPAEPSQPLSQSSQVTQSCARRSKHNTASPAPTGERSVPAVPSKYPLGESACIVSTTPIRYPGFCSTSAPVFKMQGNKAVAARTAV